MPPSSASDTPLHVLEARRLGHGYIGCEHLLLGILAEQRDVVAKILHRHGVTLEGCRRRLLEIVGGSPGDSDSEVLSYTLRATVVRKLAEIEAERLGAHRPTNAHLLLAMLTEGQGVPNVIFGESAVRWSCR